MRTFNVTLSATYTVNAVDEMDAIYKAKQRAEVYDLDCGSSDIEELDYDPEYDDVEDYEED